MRTLRRRLAAFALITCVMLCGSVVGVSAACCAGGGSTTIIQPGDCCPPGSHPGRACPMHRDRAEARASRTHGTTAICPCQSHTPLGLLVAGVMPAPPVVTTPLVRTIAWTAAPKSIIDFPPVPTAPPPRA